MQQHEKTPSNQFCPREQVLRLFSEYHNTAAREGMLSPTAQDMWREIEQKVRSL